VIGCRGKVLTWFPPRGRWYHYSLYPDVFVGSEAVTWFVETGCVSNRAEGVALGQKLLEANFFHHVVGHVWPVCVLPLV
jgi:Domain found in Dishevelled, Egl-10, and Pleckstrin (DEP)